MYALSQSFEECILLYILPCKPFKNVKARKNGTTVSLMHPFLGVETLFVSNGYCYESIKGKYLSLEIRIAAIQHRWIRCLAFSQDDAIQDRFVLLAFANMLTLSGFSECDSRCCLTLLIQAGMCSLVFLSQIKEWLRAKESRCKECY